MDIVEADAPATTRRRYIRPFPPREWDGTELDLTHIMSLRSAYEWASIVRTKSDGPERLESRKTEDEQRVVWAIISGGRAEACKRCGPNCFTTKQSSTTAGARAASQAPASQMATPTFSSAASQFPEPTASPTSLTPSSSLPSLSTLLTHSLELKSAMPGSRLAGSDLGCPTSKRRKLAVADMKGEQPSNIVKPGARIASASGFAKRKRSSSMIGVAIDVRVSAGTKRPCRVATSSASSTTRMVPQPDEHAGMFHDVREEMDAVFHDCPQEPASQLVDVD